MVERKNTRKTLMTNMLKHRAETNRKTVSPIWQLLTALYKNVYAHVLLCFQFMEKLHFDVNECSFLLFPILLYLIVLIECHFGLVKC